VTSRRTIFRLAGRLKPHATHAKWRIDGITLMLFGHVAAMRDRIGIDRKQE
jgi:hypothetical protein